jgi:YtkA-like
MEKTAIVSLILLLIAGIAYAKNCEVAKKTGEYTIVATIDKNPPIVGDNTITIELKDASGKAITDARVKIEYSMPAMPGMPAMNYKSDAALKNGYQAQMNLSMAGSWNVVIKIIRAERLQA